mmetsp:Transcript_16659/g.31189  ORF Transcript_16659/g.31189 Transcript_16659/m.31189 type:complete len:241 (-) Transcript_16659:143-865(-)
MRTQTIQRLLAVFLLASLAVVARGDAFLTSSPRAAFAKRLSSLQQQLQQAELTVELQHRLVSMRGGATVVADDDDDEEEEEEEESEDEEDEVVELDSDDEEEQEEEEEEESKTLDASLAAAALKSTKKAKAKAQLSKSSNVKKTMSSKLATPKKKGSLLKFFRVPYIIRACLNPFTVMSMSKHYWLSLMNLDYPPKDSSQDLRSALDDKARKGGPTQARGKRKMKRGQAKTLSDLPKLNT